MDRAALVVGGLDVRQRGQLLDAARSANYQLHGAPTTASALDWLDQQQADVVLVPHAQAEELSIALRSRRREALVPLLTLAPAATELSFVESFSWGADDVVPLDRLDALSPRLRRLPERRPAGPRAEGARTAIIASAERSRRVVLARVLVSARYGIRFAADLDEIEAQLAQEPPRLLVFEPDTAETCERLGALAAKTPETLFIVSAPPRRLKPLAHAVGNHENLAFTDSFAPPENVVFLANELGRSGAPDNRASRRLLYGALVHFRSAGREHDTLGLTYNISVGGMYVRSLAPPVEDTLWLELTPPRTERRVRLEAQVCWRRAFGPSTLATVPPGFGVRISDGAKAELSAWERGYAALARMLAA